MIPYPSNPQSWNRYSYVKNNPLNFVDPTGHKELEDDLGGAGSTSSNPTYSTNQKNGSNKPKDKHEVKGALCDRLPKLCEGGQWNPLTYETIGIQFEFDLKLGGGIEIRPFLLMNGDDLRNLDFENIEGALGVSFEVSSGLSAEVAGGISLIGSDGSVLDQDGMQPPTANAAACIPGISFCLSSEGSYSPSQKKLTSISYTAGSGEGADFSLGQSVNSIIAYGDNNKGWWKIPFFPKQFPVEYGSPIH